MHAGHSNAKRCEAHNLNRTTHLGFKDTSTINPQPWTLKYR